MGELFVYWFVGYFGLAKRFKFYAPLLCEWFFGDICFSLVGLLACYRVALILTAD